MAGVGHGAVGLGLGFDAGGFGSSVNGFSGSVTSGALNGANMGTRDGSGSGDERVPDVSSCCCALLRADDERSYEFELELEQGFIFDKIK